MAAIVFMIIFLVAGITGMFMLNSYKKVKYQQNRYGYITDENGEKIVDSESHPYKKFGWLSFAGGVLLAVVILLGSTIITIPTGHTGILTTFGRVESNTLEAGVHFKAPYQSVIKMDNRVQKATINLYCFSADLQEVNIVYTVNYQINKANASEIYRTVGKSYFDTIIAPNINDSVKTVVGKYTAEDLILSRTELQIAIEETLSKNLENYNIEVASTAVEDMDFTDTFTNAVEAKQVAAQKKLQAEIEQAQRVMEQEAAAQIQIIEAEAAAQVVEINANAAAEAAKIKAQADLEIVKIEADGVEYAGQKEAAANKAIADSITDELVNYYYINNWNGELPDTYVGSDNVSTILNNNSNK